MPPTLGHWTSTAEFHSWSSHSLSRTSGQMSVFVYFSSVLLGMRGELVFRVGLSSTCGACEGAPRLLTPSGPCGLHSFPSPVVQAQGESYVCVPSHLSGLVVTQGGQPGLKPRPQNGDDTTACKCCSGVGVTVQIRAPGRRLSAVFETEHQKESASPCFHV